MSSPDNLRYPVGLFTLPPSVDADARARAIETLAQCPRAMRDAVAGLEDTQLDTPYRPGGWTVRQVVHHVPDSHLNAYVRLKLALTEDTPTIQPYDEKAWAILPDSSGPIAVSLALLEALHERWVNLWRALPSEAWSRPFRHPEIGVLRVEQLLALYEWHSRHHVAHITTLRQRQGW